MSTISGCDNHNHKNSHYTSSNSQPRGFLTPPPTWRTNLSYHPVMPASETKPRHVKSDLFHVIHKVPSGDSPYVRAKHVQLIDKDPSKAISLFWAAINSGDRVDSALKDMAVVMKQLERSDEAIEAIKSFRHLCPPESQESLDNILVELYKKSGRIEEEIEMLQRKLKQVEEGIAYGQRRMKMARSQGKKIQITMEKEYARVLGNLAWAYMQQKDYKSAEEHYRKALCLESDKNKQCNLAVCLMNMNRLTEAKILLQTINASSADQPMDESYAKSFERAHQMLVELELQQVSRMSRPLVDGHVGRDIPCREWKAMTKGAFTESPYDTPCTEGIPKVPLTQPRRSTWSLSNGDYRKGWLTKNADVGPRKKLSFEKSADDENGQFLPKQILKRTKEVPQKKSSNNCTSGNSTSMLQFNVEEGLKANSLACHVQIPPNNKDDPSELSFAADSRAMEASDRDHYSHISAGTREAKGVWGDISPTQELKTNLDKTYDFSTCGKKSWADMAEEDEEEFPSLDFSIFLSYRTRGKCSTDFLDKEELNDENMDSNIMSETPALLNQIDHLSQKMEATDLGCGYYTQPQMNQPVRRSLCFDQQQMSGVQESDFPSPLRTKALNFEDHAFPPSEVCNSSDSMKSRRRNRLQVFKDITHASGSPRPTAI